MKNYLLFAAYLLLGAISIGAQSSGRQHLDYTKDEAAVLKINEEFDRAIVARDVAAYERIYADDFIFTSSDGAVTNREQEITRARTGSLQFESGKSDDLRVKIYGNTGVVTGLFTARGKNNGKDFSFVERYTAVFVKRGNRWQLVAEHASEVKPK